MNRPSRFRTTVLAASLLAAASGVAIAQDSFSAPPQPYPAQSTQGPQQQPQYPQQPYPPQQQAYPPPQGPQGPYPPPQPPPSGWPAAQDPAAPYPPPAGPAPAGTDPMARLVQFERQDLAVPPSPRLRSGAMHGPTPPAIPGGRLVTTPELVRLLQDPRSGVLVFDVLGGPQVLPNAIPVVPASQGGDFQDQVQRDFGNYLQQVTQGRKDRPMVFYCQSTQCWMSYNAALRAINLGYTNVLWYRGGIEAWQQAGGPVQSQGQAPPR